jgi:hypothetical protein
MPVNKQGLDPNGTQSQVQVGGPWLRRIWPQGEMASVLPSGCRMSFQPRRWMQT